MCKGTESATWAVTGVLDIIAFCWLVYLRMKLLFSPSVAILTLISSLANARITPFISRFYIRARSWSAIKQMHQKLCHKISFDDITTLLVYIFMYTQVIQLFSLDIPNFPHKNYTDKSKYNPFKNKGNIFADFYSYQFPWILWLAHEKKRSKFAHYT